METIEISKTLFKKLEKLKLDKRIYNTEAEMLIIPNKEKWNKNVKLLKRLYTDVGDSFGNKLLTLNALIDRKDLININEIVFPEKIAIYNKSIIGFTMPYIENINFEVLLNDKNIEDSFKKELLKQIGNILNEIKKIREHGVVSDFYLNDLHEGNFIYNIKSKKINVIDMDSCKIAGNYSFPSKYLTSSSNVASMPYKYKVNKNTTYTGYIVADENSDLYCYNTIVLNFLFGDKVNKLTIKDFYLYLDYLRSLGYKNQILDVFAKIYEPCDNESIAPYIDMFPTDYKTVALSKKKVFNSKTK